MFETGLISSEDNLFVLREAFLSNSHLPPNLMLVNYEVNITNVTHRSEKMLWSNSRIYTIIHPNLISALQSGIMSIIFYYEELLYVPEITLYLMVKDKSNVTPNSIEIEYALSTINEKVKYNREVEYHVNP